MVVNEKIQHEEGEEYRGDTARVFATVLQPQARPTEASPNLKSRLLDVPLEPSPGIDSIYGFGANFDPCRCQMITNRFANQRIVIDD